MSVTIALRIKHKAYQLCIVKDGFSRRIIKLYDEITVPDREILISRLRDDLSEILKTYRPQKAVLLLPFRYITTTTLKLPLKKRREIEQALPFELEKSLPLPVDDYNITFYIKRRDLKETEVVAMSILKKETEQYVAVLEEFGITTTAIKSYFIETINTILQQGLIKKQKDAVFIQEEEGHFNIAYIKDGKAAEFRHTKNSNLVQAALKSLSTEPLPVYFSGSPSAGLDIDIREEISVDPYSVLLTSLRERGPLKLNFMPRSKQQSQLRFIYALGALALFSLILHSLSIVIPYYRSQTALKKIEHQISTIESQASDVLEMSKKLDALERELNEITSIRHQGLLAIKALEELTRILPEHTWVTMFKYKAGSIEIAGFSERAVDIIKRLEASDLFKNVRFTSPVISRQGKERFVLRMEIEGWKEG